MRYGISVPNFAEYGDCRVLADLARDAEAAGWDGFFLWDHVLFQKDRPMPVVDPWIALATIALATERVQIGPMVTPLARRRPWKVAREAVTIDHLSHGRLILGVGLGDPPQVEFASFGEEADSRVRARQLDEALDILAGLWSGRPFSYTGEHFRIDDVTFLPTPMRSPRIPIWVAGVWPNKRPARRAARWDGYFPMRSGDAPISVEDAQEIGAYIAAQRDTDGPFDLVVYGETQHTPADIARVRSLADAGATWWIESVDPLSETLERLRARIRQGPPATP